MLCSFGCAFRAFKNQKSMAFEKMQFGIGWSDSRPETSALDRISEEKVVSFDVPDWAHHFLQT